MDSSQLSVAPCLSVSALLCLVRAGVVFQSFERHKSTIDIIQ